MPKRKYGLATGAGVFFDDESGLKVLQGRQVEIDPKTATEKTRLAISSGALLEVSEDEETQPESDLPEGLPGREAFIAAGMSFESVKNFDFESDKVPGVGAKTIEALKDFLKNANSK